MASSFRCISNMSAPPPPVPAPTAVQVGEVTAGNYTKEEKRLINHTMEESPVRVHLGLGSAKEFYDVVN